MIKFMLISLGWSLLVIASICLPLLVQWIAFAGPEWMLGEDGYVGGGVLLSMVATWLTSLLVAIAWHCFVLEWWR